MPKEIERKFLVNGQPWRQAQGGVPMRQGYLHPGPPAAVRVRIAVDHAWLCVKVGHTGIERDEFEYPIPSAHAESLIVHCQGVIIEKTRYRLTHAGSLWEIDVFEGLNAGLVVAEIELDHPDAPLEPPPWLGPEVSGDRRYLNAHLASHPYSKWQEGSV